MQGVAVAPFPPPFDSRAKPLRNMDFHDTPRWRSSCTSRDACSRGEILGAQVTTLFGTPETQPKTRKHTLLPLLTVLFLISYGLMTLLIVEQGSTIQSQRTLIQQLIGDSSELSSLKGKAFQKRQAHAPKRKLRHRTTLRFKLRQPRQYRPRRRPPAITAKCRDPCLKSRPCRRRILQILVEL